MLLKQSLQLILFSTITLIANASPLSFVAGDNFPIIHGELLANISRELQRELQGELMRTTASPIQPIDGEVEGREAAIQRGRAVIEEFRRSFKEAQATTESASNFVIDSLIDFPAPSDDFQSTKPQGSLLDSGDEDQTKGEDRKIARISANSTEERDEMPVPPQFPIFSNGKLSEAASVESITLSPVEELTAKSTAKIAEIATTVAPKSAEKSSTPKPRRRLPSAVAFRGDQDLAASVESNDPKTKPSPIITDETSLPDSDPADPETQNPPKASIRTLIDADSSTPTSNASTRRPLIQLQPSQPFGSHALRPIAWQQCSDTAADCIERADLCEHPEYRNLMWRMCPATCDACFRTPEGPACADASPLCGKKAKYCGISYFRGIMHRVCPKTCKTC